MAKAIAHKCGCSIQLAHPEDNFDTKIIYCQKHATVDRLLKAAKEVTTYNPGRFAPSEHTLEILRKVIASAEKEVS